MNNVNVHTAEARLLTDRIGEVAAIAGALRLDGEFAAGAVLQVKHGPMDFQAREPVSPLARRAPRPSAGPTAVRH